MRLIEKIILLLLSISLLPLVVVGGLFYSSVKTTLENQTKEHLSSIATIQKQRLVDIRSQNVKRLADFTSRMQLRTLLEIHNRTQDKNAQSQIAAILDDAKKLGEDIHGIIIFDTTGAVVATTENNSVRSRLKASELFKLGIDKNSTRLVSNARGVDPVFYLSGPLVLEGSTIGVAGIEVSADELLQTVSDHTGLGNTGEIALGQWLESGEVSYITSLRFDKDAANRVITDPELPVYKALTGEEKVYSDIKDYRGHDVLAATRFIEDSGWGLVAKIDRSEAFLPLRRLRSEFILLIFINSVLVVFAAIALARRVTQPILDIDEVAELTSKGTLKNRVTNTSDDEIGNLAGTFNEMLDNLEELDKAKNDFVSLASHQLRTPLTATKWTSEELLAPGEGLTDARKNHYLRQIHASNERMIRLVNELLDASKIGFGTLSDKPEPVRIEEVLKHILRDIAPEILDSGVKVTKHVEKDLPVTYIDRTWVQVILQNLVSNAAKYSKSGQTVAIEIKRQKNDILITVADSGCGIPLSQQSKIFTKLFRADNARQLVGDGSGLGLYISKALVEQAGGEIRFESVENEGTTFYVKLPIKHK